MPFINFDQVNIDCAKRYIQNVVVVDNQLFFGEKPSPKVVPKQLKAPKAGPKKRKPLAKNTEETGPENSFIHEKYDLDANQLVDAFADYGIACSPYRPSTENEKVISRRATAIARNSDIVLLDWHLGKSGHLLSVNVLKCILEQDKSIGGRLRLIAIYTGEIDVLNVSNIVREEVFEKDALSVEEVENAEDTAPLTIKDGQTTVIFINKKSVEGGLDRVKCLSPRELPENLISEFANLTDGLMPNVALASIAAIREASNHILTRFDGSLDPAILHHRSVIDVPEDAEAYSVTLIADELKAVLETAEIGPSQLGADKIKLWLEKKQAQGFKFGLGNPKEDWPIAAPLRLVERGKQDQGRFINRFKKADGNPYGKNELKKNLISIFSNDASPEGSGLLKLARRDVLSVEALDLPFTAPKWFPSLKLGSLVHRTNNDFSELLLCICPLCDSVRVELSSSFDFVRLTESDKQKAAYVIALPDGTDGYYNIDYTNELTAFKFKPKIGKDRIYARKVSEKYVFTNSSNIKFQWLGYFKDFYAFDIMRRLSEQRSRIGSDVFEWLRDKGLR